MKAVEVRDHIVTWLKDYSEHSKTKGFVVGVSGGIDSAVTSALAAHTGLPVVCLEMPIYQAAAQVTRAAKHIDFLVDHFPNVKRQEVELTEVFERFSAAVPDTANLHREMALVNTRARLRMTTLYYFATLHQSLVVGTGNKVEDFGVGFFTKYGDGGVDLSPIADLTKTEVYELGAVLGVIPQIMQAPPTDGLWGDDRTDEDQIGASYPELEWAMAYQHSGGSREDLVGRKREVYDIYMRMHTANQHKMVPIPVCEIPHELR